MNKPHKHAALIKAWADGAEIQRCSPIRGWENCYTTPAWDNPLEQFRIKPKSIKYRNYMWRCSAAEHRVHISVAYTDIVINDPAFIKWIGDWQTVEVE